MSFSKRCGFKEPTIFQKESMNEDLRISLWNVVFKFYLDVDDEELRNIIFRNIWSSFLKKPLDTMHGYYYDFPEIKDFYFKAKWYEVYDFIEFLLLLAYVRVSDRGNIRYEFNKSQLKIYAFLFNKVLKTENAAYRIIDSHVTPITSDEEIEDIKTAFNTPLDNVNSHIKQALELYSDRKNPDYRNSIKESITAVEAIARTITGESTLDKALKRLEKYFTINNQLKEGLKNIYYWTNGGDGIRHALMDDSNISEEDARFMLVSCSAFVNYLISKASKAEIEVK